MAGKRKIVESCIESWLEVLAWYIGILTLVCKQFSSRRLKFPVKIAHKYVENLKQAFREI